MIDDSTDKETKRRLAEIELKFERRFRRLQDAYESRLASVEAKVKSALARVEEMSEDMTITIDNTNFLNDARKTQGVAIDDLDDAIDAVIDTMREMEDRLGPAFHKTFPEHSNYIQAMLNVIEKKPDGQH